MSDVNMSRAPTFWRSELLADTLGNVWYKTGFFWRVASTLFLIATTLLLTGWFAWHQTEAEHRNDLTLRQLIIDTEDQATGLLRWYETAIQTAKLSALHPAVRGFRSNPAAAREYFKDLSTVVQRFSQLRILLPDGMEAMRVDSRNEEIFIVSPNQFQDKGDRYYYDAARQLRPGQVYISRLDLNVEHGRLEVPYRPTSRLITPIVGTSEDVIGYFVINLDMAEGLSGFTTSKDSQISRELLNREGYWLAGVSNDRLWGFMRDVPVTLAQENAELWTRINKIDRRGSFSLGGMIYSVAAVSVADLADASGQELFLPDQPKLFIVSKAAQYGRWFDIQWFDVLVLLGLVIVVAGVSVLIGYLVIRRKQAQGMQQRVEANLVAVQRMAALGRIVAGVAHEMRTPLGNALTVSTTVIHDLDNMMIEFAKNSHHSLSADDIDHLRRGVHIIQKNIDRTSALVRNFRETATDQSNHVRRKFDLYGVTRNLVGTMEAQLAKKGISLTASGPTPAPIDSFSDAVDQVLLSLINNAERHAFVGRETGTIDIQIIDYDEKFYQLILSDNGVGIDPRDHEHVFEPFWSSDRADRGSGLGLTIVANIVVGVLGGDVSVQSETGLGTSFILMIPKIVPDRENQNPYSFENSAKRQNVSLGSADQKFSG